MGAPSDIDQDAKRREWRWERVGWGAMALVILLAAAGLFGGGPVAHVTTEGATDGLRAAATYERFDRTDRVNLLVLEIEAEGLAKDDEVRVAFSDALTSGWTIRSSQPGNDGAGVGADGAWYGFTVGEPVRAFVVAFEYLPERVGNLRGTLTIEAPDAPPLTIPIRQFVYP